MKKIVLIILAVLTMAGCGSGREVTPAAQKPQARQEIPVVAPTAGEKARDGRFIAYDNGTVRDTRTGLMWAAKDSVSPIKWQGAKSYCENYRGGGYTGWRMPTQNELEGLYDTAKAYKPDCGNAVHLTGLIRLTCGYTWSSETRGSEAALFDFFNGRRLWRPQTGGDIRALSVHSGK